MKPGRTDSCRESHDGQEAMGRTNAAGIDEAQPVIRVAFPEAEFRVHRGGDPGGIYIDA
jgi:hypothetical protein